MRWANTRRYPRRIVNPAISDGVYDPKASATLRIAPDLFRVIRRRPLANANAVAALIWAATPVVMSATYLIVRVL